MQSETKQVYTFATPAFQRVVSTPHGQAMIQKYLTEDAEEPSAMEVELVMQGGVLQPLYGENTDDIAAQQPTLDAASALVHSAARVKRMGLVSAMLKARARSAALELRGDKLQAPRYQLPATSY